jgi:tRNA modification GTPase
MTVRVARLTPAGMGGVATIAIVGPGAWPIVRSLFRTANGDEAPKQSPKPGSMRFGRFGEPPGDEVVLAVRPGTPVPWFEVHCHGGEQVVAWLIEQVVERGAAPVSWVELEETRAGSWVRATAAEQLGRALTLKTAAVLLDQANGALEVEVKKLLAMNAAAEGRERARNEIRELSERWRVGRRLTRPWRVAFVGTPNAGKSSLVNAIAGFERAVVTAIPGTTRDAVTTLVALDGWPVELIDTAGLRETADALECEGIALGRVAADSADLRVWVVDATAPVPPPAGDFLVVANKCDLVTSDVSLQASAATGAGVPGLIAAIVSRLSPAAPAGTAVPFTEEIAAIVQRAAGGSPAALGELLQPRREPGR